MHAICSQRRLEAGRAPESCLSLPGSGPQEAGTSPSTSSSWVASLADGSLALPEPFLSVANDIIRTGVPHLSRWNTGQGHCRRRGTWQVCEVWAPELLARKLVGDRQALP